MTFKLLASMLAVLTLCSCESDKDYSQLTISELNSFSAEGTNWTPIVIFLKLNWVSKEWLTENMPILRPLSNALIRLTK